mmetsp:Transcript_4783/g.11333  ORF Transcript_4783/g.11333 Transcript_4783/m.11333 type:complete len:130 (-) Transcript_4783:66-455(-)
MVVRFRLRSLMQKNLLDVTKASRHTPMMKWVQKQTLRTMPVTQKLMPPNPSSMNDAEEPPLVGYSRRAQCECTSQKEAAHNSESKENTGGPYMVLGGHTSELGLRVVRITSVRFQSKVTKILHGCEFDL